MSETKCLLSAESLDLLKKCKNKTIIELGSLNESEIDSTLWSILIKFDDNTVGELSICLKGMQLLGKNETISSLVYKSVDEKQRDDKGSTRIVSLRVDTIEIYTETIVSADPELGDDIIILDSGISFNSTDGTTISFALGKEYYDDDWISFGKGRTIDDLRPLTDIAETWGDGVSGHSVKVERSVRFL